MQLTPFILVTHQPALDTNLQSTRPVTQNVPLLLTQNLVARRIRANSKLMVFRIENEIDCNRLQDALQILLVGKCILDVANGNRRLALLAPNRKLASSHDRHNLVVKAILTAEMTTDGKSFRVSRFPAVIASHRFLRDNSGPVFTGNVMHGPHSILHQFRHILTRSRGEVNLDTSNLWIEFDTATHISEGLDLRRCSEGRVPDCPFAKTGGVLKRN
mmetsp:Transcript_80950/g.217099  ORF Transcript_80950/g.217099 Transcript_80950/m.217099 type:complete len:216 (+) Transcript_80950:2184-2831(+)